MKALFLVGMLVALGMGGCGGASKPPMQPDSDSTASLGDGGPDPASPAPQPAPAPPK
jgi:hypothetical protein